MPPHKDGWLLILILLVLTCEVYRLAHRNSQNRARQIKSPEQESDLMGIRSLLYARPDQPWVLGRPFSGIAGYEQVLRDYLATPEVELSRANAGIILSPQLVTGISADHFEQHRASRESLFEKFNIAKNNSKSSSKILIFDLGLTSEQAQFIKKDTRYIYKQFDFTRYPPHVSYLRGYAFKIFTLLECISQFQNCLWFDASIVFWRDAQALITKYVLENRSSFVYYIKPGTHNPAFATHPEMFAYLPSNISHFNLDQDLSQQIGQNRSTYWRLSQSGAIITYNTRFFKHKIMKYAIACALTVECINPLFELTENMRPNRESGFAV